MRLALLFLGLFFTFTHHCFSEKNKKKRVDKKITVIGIAEHAKLGAIIVSDEEVYYIENKENWDDLYKKKLKVTGIPKTEKGAESEADLKDKDGNFKAGFVGTRTILTNATWEVYR